MRNILHSFQQNMAIYVQGLGTSEISQSERISSDWYTPKGKPQKDLIPYRVSRLINIHLSTLFVRRQVYVCKHK